MMMITLPSMMLHIMNHPPDPINVSSHRRGPTHIGGIFRKRGTEMKKRRNKGKKNKTRGNGNEKNKTKTSSPKKQKKIAERSLSSWRGGGL